MRDELKRIPNILSVIRILLSLLLFITKPLSVYFYLVYFICGLSDILDGYIARRIKSTSTLGATLDSIGDMILLGVMMIILLPRITMPTYILIWILLIGLIRGMALIIGYYKYQSFVILHTHSNRLTGLLLFLFPFVYGFIDIHILGMTICLVASYSVLEEIVIHITSSTLIRDRRGLYDLYKHDT